MLTSGLRLVGGSQHMMISEVKCPHGRNAVDGRYQGVFAAPFYTCKCCGVHFPYIDSGSYSYSSTGKATIESRTWTKNLCFECGGHYEYWGDAAA
jgi:hypothetical protein